MTGQLYQLVMRSGPTPNRIYPISKSEIYVGRDISNDIPVNDAEISRKHARLSLQGDAFVVEDLGSTNGTFVDGQRLMGPHILRSGELIMFGENVGMVFEAAVYDPNSTVVASGPVVSPVVSLPVSPQPQPIAPPAAVPYAPQPVTPQYAAPAAQPVYAQQIPASPAPMYAQPPAPKKKAGCGRWLLAGCGCLVMLLCLVVVAVGAWYALDATGFENSVTKIICSSTLESVTNEILKLFGNYACPAG